MMYVPVMRQLPTSQVSNIFYPLNRSLEEEFERLFTNFTIKHQATPIQNAYSYILSYIWIRDFIFSNYTSVDDVMEEFRHNGRDFEYCPDMDNETVPEITPRRKKSKKPLPTECVFCRNNGEEETYYRKHMLKDAEGRVKCPILRAYKCPICGACGDEAHTIKYCPLRPKGFGSLTVSTFKHMKNSVGKRRVK